MDTPSPTDAAPSPNELFARYLDAFRSQISESVAAMSDEEATRARLPTGWTPLGLVVHLTYVERRWLVWGFLGQSVEDPWGDWLDGRWRAPSAASRAVVLDELAAQGRRSTEVILGHGMKDVGMPSPRWDGNPPPALERVCLHLVQEYARHAGHLDVLVELAAP